MVRHKIFLAIHIHAQWVLIVVLSATSLLSGYGQAQAATMPNRRVAIGTSRPSAVTSHRFSFDIATAATLGSVEFEYCDNTPFVGAPCSVPAGLNVNAATLTTQAGEAGFSIHPSSGGHRLVLARVPTAATPQPSSYGFNGIVNPSDQQRTIYVRISTFASNDASGVRIDEGTVVFSTARNLLVTGYVPPYLTFCVGVTVATNCSATEGNFIDFGELQRNLPSTATSQFAGATNDVTGYSVGVYGNTMTSGNNVIPPLTSNSSSATGTSQYGLNLRRNSAPGLGQNPVGSGTADPVGGYGTPNSFRFVSGETLASSPLSTDFNRFTVSYLINVSAAQQPGVYAATMTYIATASF